MEVLVLGTYKSLPFTHCYFHNALVNLLLNKPAMRYLRLFHEWSQENIKKLYICSCIRDWKEEGSEPIYDNSYSYL